MYRTLLALSWTNFGLRFVVLQVDSRPFFNVVAWADRASVSVAAAFSSDTSLYSLSSTPTSMVTGLEQTRRSGSFARPKNLTTEAMFRWVSLALAPFVAYSNVLSKLLVRSFHPFRTRSLSLLEPKHLTSPLPEQTSSRVRSELDPFVRTRPRLLQSSFPSLSPLARLISLSYLW